MWEETGSGRPFLSQLSCGGGEPVATHSMLMELSRTVVNSSNTFSLLPFITGGTTEYEEFEINNIGINSNPVVARENLKLQELHITYCVFDVHTP